MYLDFANLNPSTYAFVGASTVINGSTLYITGGPKAGINATITNSHGLLIDAGVVSGLGTVTNGFGLTVNAPTGATNNFSAQFLGGLGVKIDGDLKLITAGNGLYIKE